MHTWMHACLFFYIEWRALSRALGSSRIGSSQYSAAVIGSPSNNEASLRESSTYGDSVDLTT